MLQRETLIAIAEGKYNLLLGSGFSVGVKNQKGGELPTGYGLEELLKKEFDMEDTSYSLQNLYEILISLGRRNTRGQLVEEFLKELFSGCLPEWHSVVARFNWSRVWTLNVDDLLENAVHRDFPNLRVRSFTWTEPFEDKIAGCVDIVHLHGYVKRDDPKLVFSISQYREASILRQAWHSVFSDFLPNEPFLIVGTSLQSEFDFQDAISRLQRRVGSLNPTILVTYKVDRHQKELLESKGVVVIESSAQEFFDSIVNDYSSIKSSKESSEILAFNFANQFSSVNQRIRQPQQHDFYSGDEPITNDILDDLDCIFKSTIQATREFQDLMLENINRPVILRVTGMPGSGKSTALLRIGRSMQSAGFPTYYYRDIEDMDTDSIVGFCRGKRIVLLFDNAGTIMPQLTHLVEKLFAENIKVGIAYSDREKYSSLVKDRLVRRGYEEDVTAEYNLLSSEDSNSLYNRLSEKGRLGRLASIRDNRIRLAEFSKKRQLVSVMYSLNYEDSHRKRMISEFYDIRDQRIKILYLLACIMNSEGFKLTISWVSAIIKMPQEDILIALDSLGSTMLRITYERGVCYISVKNKYFSQDFMRFHNKSVDAHGDYLEFKYSTILHFLKWLSTHVDQNFYNHNSKFYQITVRLLSYSLLRNWISNAYVKQIYEDLKPWWIKNARFWEQYALFHASSNQYNIAASYANTALRIRSDSFTNNTAGKIFIEQSYKSLEVGTPVSLESLMKGIQLLHKSYEQDKISKYQFPTFFSNIFKYIEANRGEIPEGISEEVERWFSLYKPYANTGDEEFDRLMQGYRLKWLRAQFPENNNRTSSGNFDRNGKFRGRRSRK